MRYKVIYLSDLFNENFTNTIQEHMEAVGGFTLNSAKVIWRKIEEYENKNKLRFVTIFSDTFIVFRSNEE